MSDDKAKFFGVFEKKVEKSFNGVGNLRPIHIETPEQGVGMNSNITTDQDSIAGQNTSSETSE